MRALAALIALLAACPLHGAEPESPFPPWKFQELKHPLMSMLIPAGWETELEPPSRPWTKGRAFHVNKDCWNLEIYQGSAWFRVRLEDHRGPWAHVRVKFVPYFSKIEPEFARLTVPIRAADDYLFQLDCRRRDQKCERCDEDGLKQPYAPIGGNCAFARGARELPWGRGYYYTSYFSDIKKGGDIGAFMSGLAGIRAVYDVTGAVGLYEFEMIVPKERESKMALYFEKMITSFRPPGALVANPKYIEMPGLELVEPPSPAPAPMKRRY